MRVFLDAYRRAFPGWRGFVRYIAAVMLFGAFILALCGIVMMLGAVINGL